MAAIQHSDRRFVNRPLWIVHSQRYETEREVYDRIVWYTQLRKQKQPYSDEEMLAVCEQGTRVASTITCIHSYVDNMLQRCCWLILPMFTSGLLKGTLLDAGG